MLEIYFCDIRNFAYMHIYVYSLRLSKNIANTNLILGDKVMTTGRDPLTLAQEGLNLITGKQYDTGTSKINEALKIAPKNRNVNYKAAQALFYLKRYAAAMLAARKSAGEFIDNPTGTPIDPVLIKKLYESSKLHLIKTNRDYKGKKATIMDLDRNGILQMYKRTKFYDAKEIPLPPYLNVQLTDLISPAALLQQALNLVAVGNYDLALTKAEIALEAEQWNRRMWLGMAQVLFQAGRYAACMLATVRANGNGITPKGKPACAATMQKLYGDAQNALAKCNTPYKGTIPTNVDLDHGGIQQMLNNCKILYEIPLSVMPVQGLTPPAKPALVLCQEGHNLALAGNYDEAIKQYNSAYAAEQSNCQMWLELAKGNFVLGRYAAAMLAAHRASGNGLTNPTNGANPDEINRIYGLSQDFLEVYKEELRKGTLSTLMEAEDPSGIKQMYDNTTFRELNQSEDNSEEEEAELRAQRKKAKRKKLIGMGIMIAGAFFVPILGSAIAAAAGVNAAATVAINAATQAALSGAVNAAAKRKNLLKGALKGLTQESVAATVVAVAKSKKPGKTLFKKVTNSAANAVVRMLPVPASTPSPMDQVAKHVARSVVTSTVDVTLKNIPKKQFLNNVVMNTATGIASELGGNVASKLHKPQREKKETKEIKEEKKPASSTKTMQSKLQKTSHSQKHAAVHKSIEQKPHIETPKQAKNTYSQNTRQLSNQDDPSNRTKVYLSPETNRELNNPPQRQEEKSENALEFFSDRVREYKEHSQRDSRCGIIANSAKNGELDQAEAFKGALNMITELKELTEKDDAGWENDMQKALVNTYIDNIAEKKAQTAYQVSYDHCMQEQKSRVLDWQDVGSTNILNLRN